MRFLLTFLLHAAAYTASIKGVPPNRLSLYLSRQSKPTTEDTAQHYFHCFDDSDSHAQLNDDYCDCQDGSDEPGTSACAGILQLTRQRDFYEEDVFQLDNFHMIFKDGSNNLPIEFTKELIQSPTPGFYCPTEQRYIPAWKVNDNICDCCDGADEDPSEACRATYDCKEVLQMREETREKRSVEMELATQKRTERVERGSVLLTEWMSAIESLPKEVTEMEREVESLKAAQSAETSAGDVGKEEEVAAKEAGLADKVKGPLSEYAKWMDTGEEKEEGPLSQPAADSIGQLSREYVTDLLRQLFSRARALWDKVWNPSDGQSNQEESSAYDPTPEDPIQILQSNIHIKTDQLAKTKAALSRKYIFDVYPELASWEGQTLHKSFAEVHLELPLFGAPSSREGFHGLRSSWGEFSEVIRSGGAIVPVPSMYRELAGPVAFRYVKGDSHSCPNGREREIAVFFVCRLGADEILAMEEPYPCLGSAVVSSEMFCGLTEFKIVPPRPDHNSLKRDEL